MNEPIHGDAVLAVVGEPSQEIRLSPGIAKAGEDDHVDIVPLQHFVEIGGGASAQFPEPGDLAQIAAVLVRIDDDAGNDAHRWDLEGSTDNRLAQLAGAEDREPDSRLALIQEAPFALVRHVGPWVWRRNKPSALGWDNSWPGYTTIVVVSLSTMAGPSITLPGSTSSSR